MENAFAGSHIDTVSICLGTIHSSAFSESSVRNITIGEFVQSGGNIPDISAYFCCNCHSLESVTCLQVWRISAFAFCNCTKLRALDMPLIDTIDQSAFYGCTMLAELDLSMCTAIRRNAFQLSGITELNMSSITVIEASAFESCANLTKFAIPDSNKVIQRIDPHVFRGCTSLESASGHSIRILNDYAFEDCWNLHTINFSLCALASATAFRNCTSLTEAYLPELNVVNSSPDDILNQTGLFENCYSLQTVNIAKLAYPPPCMFANCINLTNLTSCFTVFATGCFHNCTSLPTLPFSFYNSAIEPDAFNGCIAFTTLPPERLFTFRSIQARAFSGCTGLKNVTLNYVIIVEDSAFENCTSLTDVNLKHVDQMTHTSFNGCTALESIRLIGVDRIPSRSFNGFGSLISITTDAAALDACCLANCPRLREIDASSAASVDDTSFQNCTQLETLKIQSRILRATMFLGCNNLTLIEGEFILVHTDCFMNHPTLTNVTSKELFEANTNCFYNCTQLQFVSSMDFVGENSFRNCVNLKQIQNDAISTTDLWDQAFYNCSSLATLKLNVRSYIGSQVFAYCASLEKVEFTGRTIYESMFRGCSSLKEFVIINVTTPDDFKIRQHAFQNCVSLTYVEGNLVNIIENYAFYGCTLLNNISLAQTKEIMDYAFSHCTSLSTLYAPLLTDIGTGGFSDCFNLQDLTSYNLKSVGPNAFQNCSHLQTVGTSHNHHFTLISSSAFALCTALRTIHVGSSTIEDFAFHGCSNLESVIGFHQPNSTWATISIGHHVFKYCCSLKSVNLGYISELGNNVFDCCEALFNVTLTNVHSIGEASFRNCLSLSHVHAPNLATAKNNAFQNTTSLSNVSFPKLESVDNYCFDHSSVVDFSASRLNTIGDYAFDGCTRLQMSDLKLLTKIGECGFRDCRALNTDMPELHQIGAYGLANCVSLQHAGSIVEKIGEGAFQGCTNITELTYHSVKAIAALAFANMTSLRKVTLSATNLSSSKVFWGDGSLEVVVLEELSNVVLDDANDTFEGCIALNELRLPVKPPSNFTQLEIANKATILLKPVDNDYSGYTGHFWEAFKKPTAKKNYTLYYILVPVGSVFVIVAFALIIFCFKYHQSKVQGSRNTKLLEMYSEREFLHQAIIADFG